METNKEKCVSEVLEIQYGKEIDNLGKTNADIVKKAKEKTEKENEDRAIAEAQRNIAKTEYLKQKTLLENRLQRAKSDVKNIYTKAICEAADAYTAGEINIDEQNKRLREADKALNEGYAKAESEYSTKIRSLRDANPTGYRAAEY